MITTLELETERLLLRPMLIGDAETVFAYRSDAAVNRYQGWIPRTIGDMHDFITNRVSRTIDVPETWFQFAIVQRESGCVIGDVGVHFSQCGTEEAEIGCTLHSLHHGRGYAVEAVRETIRYLFTTLGKRRVTASIDPRNTKSVAMVERVGFRKAYEHNGRIQINGEWVDDAIYEIIGK